MVTLDYTEASVHGGLPTTSDNVTCDEFMYACGLLPPRHPLPTILAGAYVLDSNISPETGALVIWFADGEVIAV